MIKNDARSIHPGDCMLHLWEATRHSVVYSYVQLCTVTGSTLAFSFAWIGFLLPPSWCCFPFYRITSSAVFVASHTAAFWFLYFCFYLFHPFCFSFLLFLSDFSSHTLSVFPKKPHFLLSFPHICLIFTVLSYCHLCKSPMTTLPLPQSNIFS